MEDFDDPGVPRTVYESCDLYKNEKVKAHITEEQLQQIADNYTSLPTFEWKLQNLRELQEHSFTRNQLLQCKWHQYLRELDQKKTRRLMCFPHVRDNHFYNYYCRYMPSLSSSSRTNQQNRLKLRPGPGEDHLGQLPTPVEELNRLREYDRKKNVKKYAK